MRVRNNEQDAKQKRTRANGLRAIKVPTACVSKHFGRASGMLGASPDALRRSSGKVLGGPGTLSRVPQGSLRVLGRILERPGTLARSHWGPRRLLSGSRNALQGPRETLGGPLGSPRSCWDSAGGVLGRTLAVTGLVWTAPRAISESLKNWWFL